MGHLWLQFPTLGCKVSFAHFLARDEETIICGAINENIELTVCLEHHELLHIRKGAGPSEASGQTKEKLCVNDILDIRKCSKADQIMGANKYSC